MAFLSRWQKEQLYKIRMDADYADLQQRPEPPRAGVVRFATEYRKKKEINSNA